MGAPCTSALQEPGQAAMHPQPVAAASSEPLRWPWVSALRPLLGTGVAELILSPVLRSEQVLSPFPCLRISISVK